MSGKRWIYLFLGTVATASLAFAACGDDDDDDADVTDEATEEATEAATEEAAEPTEEEAAEGEALELDLEALNDSGVSGTATLTDNGDGTTNVVLAVEGDDATVPHPAHIHVDPGECLDAADIIADLTPVEGGSSTTDVDVALADIQATEHVIIIHESVENIGNYIACAEIPPA
ncbi:MAG TPA: hypothetical protein VFZ12_06485 [Dehalococcoidia bacterium]|nr:hypothetical protein [Dehalococcoidia bacterium]